MHRRGRCSIAYRVILLWAALVSGYTRAQGLEEIIVTAEKRATTIQDTAIVVSAFSGAELDRALITNALDMQLNVPNMLMSRDNFTSAAISIRGAGNQAVGATADSGTGVHFNGVYLNNARVLEAEFYDAERVEVLRGPQGTLYGRNTTAGVVNLITRKPDSEFAGNINLELGNYGHIKTKGALNIPLTASLSQRFALFSLDRKGFVDNAFDDTDIDGRNMYSLRSSTRWGGHQTAATLVVNYFNEDSTRMRGSNQQCQRDPDGIIGCLPTSLANQRTHSGATVTGFLINNLVAAAQGQDYPDDDFVNSKISKNPRKQYLDFTPVYEVEDWMASFELNHEFDKFTVTALTGYHNSRLDARNDYDFAVASEPWPVAVTVHRGPEGPIEVSRAYSSDRATTNPEQWSQELRLASDFDGDWNFMVGAFWLDYESDVHYYIYSAALELFGSQFGIDPSQRLFDNDTHSYHLTTWATFGELYWQTTDSVSMTLGLRYTDENKSSRQRSIYLNFLNDPTRPDGDYNAFNGAWSEPTGKFSSTWNVSDDVMTYATLSRSYKSGGFNPVSADSVLLQQNPDLADFDPEFINALEIGVKTRLLDNTLQANATWFYYDYKGLQIAKITRQTSLNENFDAAIQGFESEITWVPDKHWTLTTTMAWLDADMNGGASVDPANINLLGTTENIVNAVNSNLYVGAGCPQGVFPCDGLETSLDGKSLPNAPEFSVNLGLAYRWPLDNGMEVTVATHYYWQDSFYTRVFNAPNDQVDEWDVWNATVTLYSHQRNWFVEAWGRNLMDDDHVTGQYIGDQNVGLATNQFLLEPRTYGLTMGYSF